MLLLYREFLRISCICQHSLAAVVGDAAAAAAVVCTATDGIDVRFARKLAAENMLSWRRFLLDYWAV